MSDPKVQKGKPADIPGPGGPGSPALQSQPQTGSGAPRKRGVPAAESVTAGRRRLPSAHPARGGWKLPRRTTAGREGGLQRGSGDSSRSVSQWAQRAPWGNRSGGPEGGDGRHLRRPAAATGRRRARPPRATPASAPASPGCLRARPPHRASLAVGGGARRRRRGWGRRAGGGLRGEGLAWATAAAAALPSGPRLPLCGHRPGASSAAANSGRREASTSRGPR